MPVEVAKLVDDFNKLWPRGTDPVSKADDHIRMIKEVLQLEFELLYNKTRVFSFEAGAVVNPDCILYYEAEKAFYQWNGTYDVNNEYVVNAGSTPETAGGIGGNAWTRSTGSGFMSTVLVSDTEPTAPFQNMLWWDTNSGTFFIYYNDGTSTQWVDLFGIADQASFNTLLFRSILARLAAESGYTLVDGSFQEGAISSGFSDVVLDWNTAKFYQWHLNENKVVPAGSTPATSGGIGASAWVDRNDETLKQDLLSGAMEIRNALFSLRDFVSVKDFGAIGDGIADDTYAINLAIAASKKIYIPDGVFIHTGITLDGVSDKYFYGSGTIKSATNQAALIGISGGANNIVFDGITFEGKITGTIDRGFNIDNSYGITIKNCTIKNFNEVGIKYGVTHAYSMTHPISIENCDIIYCGTGIFCVGEYAAIRGNRIRLCGTIWSANGVTIDNYGLNSAAIGADSGWGMKGSFGNCRIENNHIQQNFYGLLLDGTLGTNPDHSHISGNQINHNQAYGMYISNIASCEQIIGNEILSTVGPGVWPTLGASLSCVFSGCKNISVIGNTIDGGSANVTRLYNVIQSQFIGNNFYIGANVTEATQCQYNTWIGNNFMGNTVGVIRHPATINRTFLANSLSNTPTETVPVGVTFLSSWGNFDAGYAPLMYWRDAEGYLNIQGVIKSTNTGDAGGVICTLPPGFRVSNAIDITVVASSGFAAVRLYSNGSIQMIGGGTTRISIAFRVKL